MDHISCIQSIQWNFKVAYAIVFRWRQLSCTSIDLYRRQNQRRHRQGLIAGNWAAPGRRFQALSIAILLCYKRFRNAP